MKTVIAFLLFGVVLLLAIASEAWGRIRCGLNWEPGGGIGRPEDYLNEEGAA